jgi:hypothetical protein
MLCSASPNPFVDGPVALDSEKFQCYAAPGQLGVGLTDNSRMDDGYRFHDAFYIGIMAALAWSPVMRSLLGVKRRSNPRIDAMDDGARAMKAEEIFPFLSLTDYLTR